MYQLVFIDSVKKRKVIIYHHRIFCLIIIVLKYTQWPWMFIGQILQQQKLF